MLKLITLHTINQIFELDATEDLSSMARMSYIACLMHYFRDRDSTIDNMGEFELPISDMKNPEHTFKWLKELEKANLITISATTVTFKNHWHRYIDKSKVNRVSPQEFLGLMDYKPATEYEQGILQNRELYDLMGMQYKLTDNQTTKLIKDFIKEQRTIGKSYNGLQDITRHCINWMNKKAINLPKNNIAKNSGKILGRD